MFLQLLVRSLQGTLHGLAPDVIHGMSSGCQQQRQEQEESFQLFNPSN
ncbi:hypothetical protein SynRS9907_00954 [Synechococcus sp. RS9907]|nr:hypothetical protein SynRS9907_00954 [Synechococcus sp. RS9907]